MSNDNKSTGFYATSAGLSASLGSLLGKLSGIPEHVLLKCALFGLMVVFNTIGLILFVKGLQCSNSSLAPTVISTATTYFCSALLGFLLFGEMTTVLWWCGTFLVLFGLVLITKAQSSEEEKEKTV